MRRRGLDQTIVTRERERQHEFIIPFRLRRLGSHTYLVLKGTGDQLRQLSSLQSRMGAAMSRKVSSR